MALQSRNAFVNAILQLTGRAVLPMALAAVAALSTTTMAMAGKRGDDAQVVVTSHGPVRGFVHPGKYKVHEFLGIPYAAPPVGDLRWRPPQPPTAWTQTLEATHFANSCPQNNLSGVFSGPPSTTEDCLYLNVFTPKLGGERKLPVLVWIPGGGFYGGESNAYDGSKLAARGPAVVVTINYRIGLLGFLAQPALDKEGHPFGNYGIMDQQLALRWVQQNIAAFGGDPRNVTLGGQSAGASSTLANVISPGAAGLFHRAILQSGPVMFAAPLALAQMRGTGFAAAVGCGSGTDTATAACLRSLSVPQILGLQGSPTSSTPDRASYLTGTMLDGAVIPMSANEAFIKRQFNHVPILSGMVQDEANFFIGIMGYHSGVPITADQFTAFVTKTFAPPAFPAGTDTKVLAKYPLAEYATPQLAFNRVFTDGVFACRMRFANQLMAKQVPVYAYQFDYQAAPYYFPPMPGFVPLAAHTLDLQFLFPLFHGGPLGTSHALSPKEEHLSDQWVDFWTTFAASGNPNGHGNRPWPRLDVNKDNYLSLNINQLTTYGESQISDKHQCGFWDAVTTY